MYKDIIDSYINIGPELDWKYLYHSCLNLQIFARVLLVKTIYGEPRIN